MKSLELNWIRNVDKSLVIPEVIFHPLDHEGLYMNPQYNEVYDGDGKPCDMEFGVIIINPDYCEGIDRILAHEWRHHWQYYHGWKYDGGRKWNESEWDYDTAVDYFKNSKSEMDAMRFEEKFAGVHELWRELLYQYL